MMTYSAVVRIMGRLTFMHLQAVSIAKSVGISLNTVEAFVGFRM